MKKWFIPIGVAVALALTATLLYFYYPQYRGAGPAFLPPVEDVTEQIAEGEFPFTLVDRSEAKIFASGLENPRVMIWDDAGRLLVSEPSAGIVLALQDTDGNGAADRRTIVASGLNAPHGLALNCADESCELYVAETDQLTVFDYQQGTASNPQKLLDLPSGGGHSTRTLLFLPYPNENTLLISIGSSCNVCNETDPLRATIQAYDIVTHELSPLASGLRNAVFMALHPVDGRVWVTEMGRDYLGDDLPPDEINIVEQGQDYGWPICYGQNVHDTVFDQNVYVRDPCADKEPSFIDLPAHVAPLGLAFIPEEGWPEEWWYDALVAYHGSWNSSVPVGYKIVRLKLDAEGNYQGQEDYLTGFLTAAGAIGRPVDILVQPGGVVYVSDDKAGVIYRIAREEGQKDDLIRVSNIKEGQVIESPLTVRGEARGNWYFEASFPIRLYDGNGIEIAVAVAMTAENWMTTEYVPFEATLTFPTPNTPTGTLILQKDNPSGLPEYDDELVIPIRFPSP